MTVLWRITATEIIKRCELVNKADLLSSPSCIILGLTIHILYFGFFTKPKSAWFTTPLNNIFPQINTTVLLTVNFYTLSCVLTVSAPFSYTELLCVHEAKYTESLLKLTCKFIGSWNLPFPQIKKLKNKFKKKQSATGKIHQSVVYWRLGPDRDGGAVQEMWCWKTVQTGWWKGKRCWSEQKVPFYYKQNDSN